LESGLAPAKDATAADAEVRLIVNEAWLDAEFSNGNDGFPFLSFLVAPVLRVLRGKKWPTPRDAQITFVGDALSGFHLEPRTAHELCQNERKKVALAEERRAGNAIHSAIPVFDVECSCGYRGQSVSGACPSCGAPVPPHLL